MALSPAGLIAEGEMRALAKHYTNVTVDEFVVMPNHIHAIIIIEGLHSYSPESSLGREQGDAASCVSTNTTTKASLSGPLPGSLSAIVRSYKSGVSRMCRAHGVMDFGWQSRFYDRILGSNAAVNAVRQYIEHNPENWGFDPYNPEAAAPGDAASCVST